MWRDQSARMARELARVVPARQADPTPWPNPNMNPDPILMPVAPVAPGKAAPEDALDSTWPRRLEQRLLGGVREDADDFWKRITRHPDPAYPEIARKAGIEGIVRLQVRLTQDGRVEVMKLLEGDTVLADAAMGAVKQWRGKPARMDGKQVDVISTVTFKFKLRD
jgi:protein TonB